MQKTHAGNVGFAFNSIVKKCWGTWLNFALNQLQADYDKATNQAIL